MAQNISLWGASYSNVPAVDLPKTGGGEARFADPSITTAVEADVASGKIFLKADGSQGMGTASGGSGDGYVWQDAQGYVHLSDEQGTQTVVEPLSVTENGTYTAQTGHAYSPVTVNVSGGGTTLKMGVIRPDAELVQSWSEDFLMVEDLGLSFPSSTASSATIRSGGTAFEPTVQLDDNNYYYYILSRYLTIPMYKTVLINTARQNYHFNVGVQEIRGGIDSMKTLDGKTVSAVTGPSLAQTSQMYKLVYYNSSNNAAAVDQIKGFYCYVSNPSISNNVLTAKKWAFVYAYNATYHSTTAFDAVDDVRVQGVLELYRVPKDSLNVKGWGLVSQAYHILNDINNGGALT